MGKNKEKKKLKQECVLLERILTSVHTDKNLQEAQLPTNKHKESPIRDISLSLESPLEKLKKKRKRKHLSEQQAEKDCPEEQHAVGQKEKGNKKSKNRKKLQNEAVTVKVKDADSEDAEHSVGTEEPPRKKRKKTKEVNVDEELERQSDEKSEEPLHRKKKKKLKMSKENNTVRRKEAEDVSVTVESETRSSVEKEKGNEKKDKSKDKESDDLAKRSKNRQSVSKTQKVISQDRAEVKKIKRKETTYAEPLKQLKKFIPDIESKDPLTIRSMIKYDLHRFKDFKRNGISVNLGRFSAEENRRLRKNVCDFMALTAVDNAAKLFFTHRFKEEQESIKKLKVLHKFFERIAEGIPRSCCYVYARGRKMFDEQNYQGVFTKEELYTLNKLHTIHGNNWKKISDLTGRSAYSLQKRYTQLAKNLGFWSKKEVQRLLRAVRDHIVRQIAGGADSVGSIRVTKQTLYKRLPWLKIANKVKTRSWTQCREKWMGILAVKMSSGSTKRDKKSLDIQIKLIKRMYEMEIDDIANVNWEDLTALIGRNLPPAYMQRKWYKLKVCHVPAWQTKCFSDVVDYLYENVLPQLEQKMVMYEDLDEKEPIQNEESYLLSDIFDINEDEDVEDNEEGNKEKEMQ